MPIRTTSASADEDLASYLRWLSAFAHVDVIVVDDSPNETFEGHARAWGNRVRHVRPRPQLATPMGKVGSVLTGVELAAHERIIVADDDVRFDVESLARVADALDNSDVVRPQNYFDPMPWHARWDTGRTLLNRMMGGDWPGTLGIRRSALRATGGYDGAVMFENLELVRTVVAAGGTERALLDVFVKRRPSTTHHFFNQRVRQAYDEIARPFRMTVQLLLLPALLTLVATGNWRTVGVGVLIIIATAEAGRRRSGGRRWFPVTAALLAPVWVLERAVCSWLALASRAVYGGIRYRGTVLRHAATPLSVLASRHARSYRPALPDREAPHQSA